MRKIRLGIIFWGLLAIITAGNDVQSFEGKGKNKGYREGELLIKFESSSSRGIVAQDLKMTRDIRVIKNFSNASLVNLPEGLEVEEAVEGLNSQGMLAEPNYFRELHPRHTRSLAELAEIPKEMPNDYYFGLQWGLNNVGQVINGEEDADIDAPEGWNISSNKGEGVIIGVIGTGIAPNHPDLAENIWINPDEIFDGKDNDGNGFIDDIIGWDFLHNRNNPVDGNGHDTFVSSIAAGSGNNYKGIAGVAWNAKIMSLKIFDSIGMSTVADELEAISYAVEKGVSVINMSYGGPQSSQIEEQTIENAPILFVCSAGNYRENSDEKPKFPASYRLPNLISVAATDAADELTDFSNFGEQTIDVGAPGKNILGAVPKRKTVFHEGFESSPLEWETGGHRNSWEVTKEQHAKGFFSLAESPGREYSNNTSSWIMSPLIDLTADLGSQLTFYIGGSAEEKDFLYIQSSKNKKDWTNEIVYLSGNFFPYITGSSGNMWYRATVDLEKYDGEKIYIRFYFKTDREGTESGYYIDEFIVTAIEENQEPGNYDFLNGTSMSAPFVTGIAALLKSEKPSLSSKEIAQLIKAGVDKKNSLLGKVATGGRVNLYNSLLLLCGDGDIAPRGNRDGIINVGDALVALRFALELEEPSANELCHGDVAPLDSRGNAVPDGQITVGDALVILRKALSLE